MRPPTRSGFTLIELLVVISIIVLLISILLPALRAARETARAVQCASDMRQIQIALSLYLQDHDSRFPPTTTSSTPIDGRWMGFFERGGYSFGSARCVTSEGDPSVGPPETLRTYAYNQALGREWPWYGLERYTDRAGDLSASHIITYSESHGWYFWNSLYGEGALCALPLSAGGRLAEAHFSGKGQNIAYLDGHVAPRMFDELTYYHWVVNP